MCIGRALNLDLRVCPQAAPAASENPGFCLLGIEVEKQCKTGQKFEGLRLKLKKTQILLVTIPKHLPQFLKNQRTILLKPKIFRLMLRIEIMIDLLDFPVGLKFLCHE